MNAAVDRYRLACDAVKEADADRHYEATAAWRALPLAAKLHVLFGEVRRTLGFAVWEIRSAAADAVQERRGER